MKYVLIPIVIIVLVAIYLIVRKSNEKKNCGRIACEPIVPVADRDETGTAQGERAVENDTVTAGASADCKKDE
jgi:hypothetical protein